MPTHDDGFIRNDLGELDLPPVKPIVESFPILNQPRDSEPYRCNRCGKLLTSRREINRGECYGCYSDESFGEDYP